MRNLLLMVIKRNICLVVLLFITSSILARKQGCFCLNVESENIRVVCVEEKFSEWFDLPAGTTFVKFRDETDNLGIRHLSYQQYINGTEILNGVVLVHVKNSIVHAVNGDIMDANIAPMSLQRRISPMEAAQCVRKNAKESDAQLKIVKAYIDGDVVYRYAYEVIEDDMSGIKYIDAESGNPIKYIPLRYNADVAGTVSTMYNGTQNITTYEQDGTYYLVDNTRGIYTLDATNNTYKINYNNDNLSQELINVINSCSHVTNISTSWQSLWDFKLQTITINTIIQNNSWYTIADGLADVYLKIKDANDNLIYISEYLVDPYLPVSFNISTPIYFSDLPLLVEIWDYDPIGDDDLVDGFIMDTFGGNMFSMEWTAINNYAQGTYTAIAAGVQPHFDAHWGMEKTIDFYSQKLNRNSYDNKGSKVYQIVNMPIDDFLFSKFPLNAFAIKIDPFPMVYGTGIFSTNSNYLDACAKPIVSIDIMAHEFTHCVTEKNGNGGLVYTGESGALNESFSDIIGIAVKNFAQGKNDWLIGNDVVVNASNIRSMRQPNNSYDGRMGLFGYPQPNTYNGRYWANPTETNNDNGGVHINSGVQNYWFYLLSEGGVGTNDHNHSFNIVGIGIDKAVQIAYRNLIYYLTPEASYEDARNGSIMATIDLYGKNSQEYKSVIEAWDAVGVYDSNQSTTITIKAHVPKDWTKPISAFTWDSKSSGWVLLQKVNNWYEYSVEADELNIVFVNGTTWDETNEYNNQTIDICIKNDACIFIGEEKQGKRSFSYQNCPREITVKAMPPVDWGNAISAWVWNEDTEGEWVSLTKEGDWYSYSRYGSQLNIIFVNGTNWSSDANQTMDISTAYDACYYIGTNEGKRTAIQTDCTGISTTNEGKSLLPNTPSLSPVTKIVKDNQLYILRDGVMYNAQGARVE